MCVCSAFISLFIHRVLRRFRATYCYCVVSCLCSSLVVTVLEGNLQGRVHGGFACCVAWMFRGGLGIDGGEKRGFDIRTEHSIIERKFGFFGACES